MKLLLEIEVEDRFAGEYADFPLEHKHEIRNILSRMLPNVTRKVKVKHLKKKVLELQSNPDCKVSPEVLFLLFADMTD